MLSSAANPIPDLPAHGEKGCRQIARACDMIGSEAAQEAQCNEPNASVAHNGRGDRAQAGASPGKYLSMRSMCEQNAARPRQ